MYVTLYYNEHFQFQMVWFCTHVVQPMFYCCKPSHCECCLHGPCADSLEDSFDREKIEMYTQIFEEALAINARARAPSYEEEDEVREYRKNRSPGQSETAGQPALTSNEYHEQLGLLDVIEEADDDDDDVFLNSEDEAFDDDDDEFESNSDRDSWESGRSSHGKSGLSRLDHAASSAVRAIKRRMNKNSTVDKKGVGVAHKREGQHGMGRRGRNMRHARQGARAARMRTSTRAHKSGRANKAASKPANRQKNRIGAKKGSGSRAKKRSSGSRGSRRK